MQRLRTCLIVLLCVLLSGGLNATWSIILIDLRTGEIAVGCATCLTGFDVRQAVSVVRVGRGAACAQSFIDDTGQNRALIFAQLQAGTAPAQILSMLAAQDAAHQTRQYGIVDTQGRAIGFTGTGAGAFAGDLTGQVGTIVYAIQGNVLTGQPVLLAAEQAVRNTAGDLADKLMAGMEAARQMGGDGRCSCGSGTPTACGSPPATFTKSAHIGHMLVARLGDLDGGCNAASGCATGNYYLNLNVANQTAAAADPVLQLRTLFLNWRLQKLLRPDHHRSTATVEPPTLLADGSTQATLRVVLRDWRSVQLPSGGAIVQVTQLPTSTAPLALGTVTDHGDGSYSLPIGPGTTVGTARLRVTADDGSGPVQLGPDPEVAVTADSLWLSRSQFEAAAGVTVDAVLAAGAAHGNQSYLLLASAAGDAPGVTLAPGLVLPLNPDFFTSLMLDFAATSAVPGLLANLDGAGHRRVTLPVPPGALNLLQGGRLHFAWLTLLPLDFTSNPGVLEVR